LRQKLGTQRALACGQIETSTLNLNHRTVYASLLHYKQAAVISIVSGGRGRVTIDLCSMRLINKVDTERSEATQNVQQLRAAVT